ILRRQPEHFFIARCSAPADGQRYLVHILGLHPNMAMDFVGSVIRSAILSKAFWAIPIVFSRSRVGQGWKHIPLSLLFGVKFSRQEPWRSCRVRGTIMAM